MSSELLIRPGLNDHDVIAGLLAPGSTRMLVPGDRGAPIDRLVADAHIASRRPQLRVAAESAGVPYMVDPLTHFWQSDLRDSDALAGLPYGSPAAKRPDDFASPLAREDLIAQVLDFEIDRGATLVIAPYLYARSPDDAWFERSLELLEATRRRMDRVGLRLPLFAILLGSHQGFAYPSSWNAGIDRFGRLARDSGATAVGIGLSPTKPTDGYAKVLATFAAMTRGKQISGLPVYAWRQGIFGAGLTASGVDGYETGIATGEACDITRSVASRRPRPGKKHAGGNAPGIFIDSLGRSIPAKVGRFLLGSSLRARVMCDDERCCPDGPASTTQHPREHAVRMRSRQLRSLDALPHTSWRLHQVAKDATAGSTLILQANQILEAGGITERLPTAGLEAMARVARHLLQESAADAA